MSFAVIVNSAIAQETNHLSRSDVFIIEGALHSSEGDFDKAIASFTKVLQFDPTNTFAIFDRASVYRAKGEYKKSISDFNKYLVLNPTNDLAYKNRASDFAAINEFDKAISDWNEALRLNPNDATALALRGFSYQTIDRFDEALNDYDQAIQIDPKNESAWNNLGGLRASCPIASMRNGKEAVEAATKACEFSNWVKPSGMDTLAAAFAEAGDFQQAIKYQKQALNLAGAIDPKYKTMQKRLALCEQQKPYRENHKH